MKTIIEGAYQRFATRCELCGCKFEYELTDVLSEVLEDSDGQRYVACPRCNRWIAHSSVYGDEDSREEITVKNENTCIGCGASIPEGRQVCPICLRKQYINK